MHDWWLALVASAFGRIGWLPQATVLYRQHSANVLGARGLGLRYWRERLARLWADPAAGGHTRAAVGQAALFAERYGTTISCLPELMQLPRRERFGVLLQLPGRARPWKHGPLRTIGLYGLLACMPRS
jgi:hypothetical protein